MTLFSEVVFWACESLDQTSKMEIIQLFKCLCNVQRLRILNLLQEGPLCVCHLMAILDDQQVAISKQLKYLKTQGLVAAERHAQWMIYRLITPHPPLLIQNLRCLQDLSTDEFDFRNDLNKRRQVIADLAHCGNAAIVELVTDPGTNSTSASPQSFEATQTCGPGCC